MPKQKILKLPALLTGFASLRHSSPTSFSLPHTVPSRGSSLHRERNSAPSTLALGCSLDPFLAAMNPAEEDGKAKRRRIRRNLKKAKRPVWEKSDKDNLLGVQSMTERKSTLHKALLKLLDVLCLEVIVLCLLECGMLFMYRNYAISFRPENM